MTHPTEFKILEILYSENTFCNHGGEYHYFSMDLNKE